MQLHTHQLEKKININSSILLYKETEFKRGTDEPHIEAGCKTVH